MHTKVSIDTFVQSFPLTETGVIASGHGTALPNAPDDSQRPAGGFVSR